MPTANSFAERRHSVRNRTLFRGKIIFNRRQSTLDCTVRNLSEGGALLVFPDSVPLPDLFELSIPIRQESRMVRSRWRDSKHIGVAFAATDKQNEPPIPLDMARRLRKLERENAALKARIAALTEGA